MVNSFWQIDKKRKLDFLSWWSSSNVMETFFAILDLPVDSPYKGQSRGALMFSLMCASTNGWATGCFRRPRGHFDVIVIFDRFITDPKVIQNLQALLNGIFRRMTAKKPGDSFHITEYYHSKINGSSPIISNLMLSWKKNKHWQPID